MIPTTEERRKALARFDDHPWVLARRESMGDLYVKQATRYIDDLPTPSRILELGSMNGTFIRSHLRPRFPDAIVVGIELMPGAIEFAHAKGGAEYISADLERPLPLSGESFDLVVGTEVLEHLYKPAMCLAEVRRVLRVDGHAVFTVPIGHYSDGGDHHTFLTGPQWIALISAHVEVQKWHMWENGNRLIVQGHKQEHRVRGLA